MLVADAVVLEQPLLGRLGDRLRTDLAALPRGDRCRLEAVQRLSGIAAGEVEQRRAALGRQRRATGQPAFGIGQRAVDDRAERIGIKRLEAIHPHARQERRVDLVVRVLGRGADEGDRPVLDVRQQRVLLALVEPMQLVDEGDGATACLAQRLRLRDQRANVGHARGHRRQLAP